MLNAAVFAQVEIPIVILYLHAHLLNAALQHLKALLALAAAYYLAYAGDQQVCRRHGLSVVIKAHIEGLDILGVIGNEHRLLIYLFGQISFVLGLKVCPPLYRIVELGTALFEYIHSLGVGYAGKVIVHHVVKAVYEALVDEAVEEAQLVRAALHYGTDYVFYHVLCGIKIPLQVAEGHLRLYHPELRGVAGGVALLRAEGGAEGVYIPECKGECLAVKLPADGQVCAGAEEILGVVHLAVRGLGYVLKIQGGYAEHLARALAVAGGDERGMYIQEAPVVKEAVYGLRNYVADPEGGLESVGARPEVLHCAQILEAVPFLLHWIIAGAEALYLYFPCLHLKWLLCIRSEHEVANYAYGTAGIYLFYYIVGYIILINHLYVPEAGAVGQLYKANILAVAHGAHPAGNFNFARVLSGILVQFTQSDHENTSKCFAFFTLHK